VLSPSELETLAHEPESDHLEHKQAKWQERFLSGLVGAVLGAAAGIPIALLLGG